MYIYIYTRSIYWDKVKDNKYTLVQGYAHILLLFNIYFYKFVPHKMPTISASSPTAISSLI